MRTITLMNSEFNINNKKLSHDMMKNAEKHNLLAPEQYGGRKHHRSVIALASYATATWRTLIK